MQNKIIIDREELELDNFNGEIEFNIDKTILNIKGHTILKEWVKDSKLDLVINLIDNSTLEYNLFGNFKNNDKKIIINQNNNTKMYYKEAYVINNNCNLKIENNILGNNNVSEIIVRLTSKNNAKILVDASLNVKKDTVNNEVKEDLRGLEKDKSKITIIPNMLVASSEVNANHNVTIGNVSDEELFYLTSKGLSKNNAIKLLETGFLISPFLDNEFKTKIKEIIK